MKKQMSIEYLVEYFNEHVLNELIMLRYSKQRLESTSDRALWNAMFAAFNVSARNLYEFLHGENDISIIQYRAFCPTFKDPNVSRVSGTRQMLNAQCFRMGKTRSKVAADKLTMGRIIGMFDWVEQSMKDLIASFGETLGIDAGKVNWSPSERPIKSGLGPTGPFAQLTTSSVTCYPIVTR